MALRKEIVSENTTNKVSYNDLDFEVEYEANENYLTISGKEQEYEPEWERMTVNHLDIGDEFEGNPEVTIYEKPDKTYNTMKVRVMDDGEILDCYFNYPKKDYPYVKGITKDFEFYRPLFNFIFNILRWRDERNVIVNGEEVTRFKSVNLETFAKYIDQMNRIGIRITEGSNGYNDWIIYKME